MLIPLIAAICAILVFAGGIWLGWFLVGRPSQHRPTRDLLVCAWIGWYAQAMLVLTLGWLGLLSPIWLGLLLLVPIAPRSSIGMPSADGF